MHHLSSNTQDPVAGQEHSPSDSHGNSWSWKSGYKSWSWKVDIIFGPGKVDIKFGPEQVDIKFGPEKVVSKVVNTVQMNRCNSCSWTWKIQDFPEQNLIFSNRYMRRSTNKANVNLILNYQRNTGGINLAKYVEMLLYPHLYLSNIAEKLSGFLQRKELVIKITWKSFALSSDADMIVTSQYIWIIVRNVLSNSNKRILHEKSWFLPWL